MDHLNYVVFAVILFIFKADYILYNIYIYIYRAVCCATDDTQQSFVSELICILSKSIGEPIIQIKRAIMCVRLAASAI